MPVKRHLTKLRKLPQQQSLIRHVLVVTMVTVHIENVVPSNALSVVDVLGIRD